MNHDHLNSVCRDQPAPHGRPGEIVPLPDFALVAALLPSSMRPDTEGETQTAATARTQGKLLRLRRGDRRPCGNISTGQWGAPLMFTYLPDVLTYLAFGVVMAACLWYVDGSLKDDAD